MIEQGSTHSSTASTDDEIAHQLDAKKSSKQGRTSIFVVEAGSYMDVQTYTQWLYNLTHLRPIKPQYFIKNMYGILFLLWIW